MSSPSNQWYRSAPRRARARGWVRFEVDAGDAGGERAHDLEVAQLHSPTTGAKLPVRGGVGRPARPLGRRAQLSKGGVVVVEEAAAAVVGAAVVEEAAAAVVGAAVVGEAAAVVVVVVVVGMDETVVDDASSIVFDDEADADNGSGAASAARTADLRRDATVARGEGCGHHGAKGGREGRAGRPRVCVGWTLNT